MLKSIQNIHLLSGAKSGNLKKVEEAIKKGADINTRKDGWTAWMHAHANCNPQVAAFLKSKGAEVTDQDRIEAGIRYGMNKACNILPDKGHHMKLARS